MIEILSLSSGSMLDLAPDTSFEIEYSNPLFEDSHIPVPFSTAITFLPTDHNKEEFGLLDAMLLEPANKRVPVELYVSGVKLMTGILIYDGMADGGINYSFSGKNLEDDWSEKIWEKNIYQIPEGNENEHRQIFEDVMSGLVDGVFAPVLINSASAADPVEYLVDPLEDVVDPAVKYHNYPQYGEYSEGSFFTPAISVLKILEDEFSNVDLDTDINTQNQLHNLALLAQYKTDCDYTETSIPADGIDVARMLPDITAMELAQIIAKIFCAAYYRDGDRFRLRSAEQVLTAAPVLDWDSRISDNAELSSEPGAKYVFGFENGTDENVYDSAAAAAESGGDVPTYYNLAEALHAMATDAYSAWRFSHTDDIYSSKKVQPLDNTEVEWPEGGTGPHYGDIRGFMSDLLLHKLESYDIEPDDNGSGTFDNGVQAKLVRCIPDTFFEKEPVSPDGHAPSIVSTVAGVFILAAITNAPNVSEDRGSDVYIGTMVTNQGSRPQQIVDKGISVGAGIRDNVAQVKPNLNPGSLYDTYHETFSNWIRSRRQVVTADLNLTMADISNFRMWQKVVFRGRSWMVRKLTLDFEAGSDIVEAVGEFVSI